MSGFVSPTSSIIPLHIYSHRCNRPGRKLILVGTASSSIPAVTPSLLSTASPMFHDMAEEPFYVKMASNVSILPCLSLTRLAWVEHLYNHPEGIDPPFEGVFEHCWTAGTKFATIEAKAGDVFITHGMIPHAATTNKLNYARVITNPHVNMCVPFNLNREDGDYVST